MDKLESYRKIIIEILKKHGENRQYLGEVTTSIIVDRENDHYMLFVDGWDKYERIYGIVYHFDIRNDKIWLQQNCTDIDIVDELLEYGIPKSDIVIGFHSPTKRKYTEFAVC